MTIKELKNFLQNNPNIDYNLEVVVITSDDNSSYATSGVYWDFEHNFLGIQLA